MTFVASVPTPINIAFNSVVSFFKKYETRAFVSTCTREFTIPGARRIILFRIAFGCGSIYVSPAVLVETDTEAFGIKGVATHVTTVNSGVLGFWCCLSSVMISASNSYLNSASRSDRVVYTRVAATGRNWMGTNRCFMGNIP